MPDRPPVRRRPRRCCRPTSTPSTRTSPRCSRPTGPVHPTPTARDLASVDPPPAARARGRGRARSRRCSAAWSGPTAAVLRAVPAPAYDWLLVPVDRAAAAADARRVRVRVGAARAGDRRLADDGMGVLAAACCRPRGAGSRRRSRRTGGSRRSVASPRRAPSRRSPSASGRIGAGGRSRGRARGRTTRRRASAPYFQPIASNWPIRSNPSARWSAVDAGLGCVIPATTRWNALEPQDVEQRGHRRPARCPRPANARVDVHRRLDRPVVRRPVAVAGRRRRTRGRRRRPRPPATACASIVFAIRAAISSARRRARARTRSTSPRRTARRSRRRRRRRRRSRAGRRRVSSSPSASVQAREPRAATRGRRFSGVRGVERVEQRPRVAQAPAVVRDVAAQRRARTPSSPSRCRASSSRLPPWM